MHNKKKPRVSVVMPIFRHSKVQLMNAISSILNQTFEDLELIIVDGTQDNKNFEIISDIDDSRIKYFRAKGYINCLNLGLKKALGAYIARMDSDDISYPTRIEEQVKFLDENPQISLCSCLIEYYGDCQNITGTSTHKKDINVFSIIEHQEFVHTAMMFRQNINLEYENLKPMEDCLLFRKLLLKGYKFDIINKVLMKSYVSKNSIMAKYPHYMKQLMSRIDVYALAKFYNYNISFIDKIFSKKEYSSQEVVEYLNFVYFLMQKSEEHNLNVRIICNPFFIYIMSKCSEHYKIITNILFYQIFVSLWISVIIKHILKFTFSITNEYFIRDYTKYKQKNLNILGIKIKIMCTKYQA